MTKEDNLHYNTHKLLALLKQGISPNLSTMNLCEYDFKHVVYLCRRYGFIEQGVLQRVKNGNGADGYFLTGAVLSPKGKEFLRQSTAYYQSL